MLGGAGGGTPDGVASWGWGIVTDPATEVRVERYVVPEAGRLSERAGWVETEVFDVPGDANIPFRVFTYSCACLGGATVGFDASGDEIVRIS